MRRCGSRIRSWGAGVAALGLVATVLSGQAAQASPAIGKAPKPQQDRSVAGRPVPVPSARVPRSVTGPIRALARTWPAAGDAIALLPATGLARVRSASVSRRAGDLPVSMANMSSVPRSVGVKVVSHAAAVQAGVNGALLGLTPAAQPLRTLATDPVSLSVSVDYAKFADAGGANFGLRLKLVRLPSCALSTPTVRSCQVQSPVASVNDAGTHTVRTTTPLRANKAMVLAAVSGPSSANGAFTASSLSPSGSWTAGGSSGAFDWSYPIAVPPPATGADVAPKVALSYDSSSIDGEIATSNNQSSWVGEGWDYNPGYIERTYRTCSDLSTAGAASYTSDQCWAGQVVTMNLGGSTTSLVQDDATGAWHVGNDDGQQVTLGTGASNGARNGEYWTITGQDGISYVFGKNVLPGDTIAHPTNSTLLEPVYAVHAGDPCYNATFALSQCNQAWRWNLDYVVDPHGNATAYHYAKQSNYYGADGATTPVAYDQASTLSYIDYGLREISGSVLAHSATDRISFTTGNRCFATDCSFTAANASNWPDTPQDQQCPSTGTCNNHAPTFWSTQRLSSIATGYYNGSTYFTVDRYDLSQSFPTAGDPQLELDQIGHTGYSATGTAGPILSVRFTSGLLANRVPNTNGQPDMYFWRLNQITSETGAYTVVTYAQPTGQSCTASTLPADPANDTQLCFPVKWTPPAYTSPLLDYFQKYVVSEVQVAPQDGRSPTQVTDYAYLGTAAWHADDNEIVKPANRTYGQFRGYGQVQTRFGNTGFTYNTVPDRQTLTTATYYRGMGGTVSDSLAETVPDNNEFAGTTREVQTFDGDSTRELSATITDLATRITTASRARTGLPALTATIVTATKIRTVTDEPGVSSSATRTATAVDVYDTLGRQVQQTDSGDDGVATTCTTWAYAEPVSGNTRYIHNRVAEKIVSQQSCPAVGAVQSPILSDVRSYYDTTGTTAGVTSFGDPTRTDTRMDAGGAATPYFAKATSAYDTAGRLVSATTHAVNTDAGRITSTAYTPTLPTTPGSPEPLAGPLTQTVVKNPLAQTVTTAFDPGRGLATDVTDVAGHPTHADYDYLGRVSAVWKPGQVHGTDPATTTYSYLIASTGPSSVTTKTLIDNGSSKNYRTSISLLDSFGQQIQTQADAVGGGRVVTDTFRDSHGWPIDTNNRWYDAATAPSTSLTSTADANVDDRTVTGHDGAGRATLSTEYTGLTATWHTNTVYGGNQTTVIPPTGGVTQTTVTDSRNETIALKQYTAPPTVTGNVVTGTSQDTTYSYTALGQQSGISSAGRTWSSTYDLGGRVTSQADPDTGTTVKTYDDLGELASTLDANNVLMTYSYDALGRKTGDYHGTLQTAAHQLYGWIYDTIQAGQLSSSTHYIGTANYTVATGSYDTAGNPLSTITSIPSTETGFAASYTTSYTWTTTHLPATVVPAVAGGLPTETIYYTYDNQGDPNTVAGLVTYVGTSTFSAYGEPTRYQLGANTQTAWLNYTRDPQTRRLTEVLFSAQNATPQIEDLQYSYDASGNLTKSVDAQGNGASAPTETQCFNYTALDQLAQAWSATDSCAQNPSTAGVGNTVVGGPQPYWQSWSFNAAGLRTQQVQHATSGPATGDLSTSYTYTTPGHADFLTSTTGALASSYTPDAVGNTTARTLTGANLSIGYDLENRTASIAGPGGTSSYVDDANGNQLVRHDPGSTTVYLPGEELTRTTSTATIKGTRYYSIGGTEVAVRAVASNFNASYLLADPHGSNETDALTTGSGIGTITRRHFDPYGNLLGATTGGTWPENHAYLDKPVDTSSGTASVTPLSDVGAREYDATTGRFLSADPVLDASSPQSLNGYDYANNNPITGSDPTGLHTDDPTDCGSACTGPSRAGPETGGAITTPGSSSDQTPPDPVNTPGLAAGMGGRGGDFTSRHNAAVRAAEAQLAMITGGQGFIGTGLKIPGGSKKANGFNGYADLVWIVNNETFIWEVKSIGESPKATAEAIWYAERQAVVTGLPAYPGFPISGLPIKTGFADDYVANGLDIGGLLYGPGSDPSARQPRRYPVTVPQVITAVAVAGLGYLGSRMVTGGTSGSGGFAGGGVPAVAGFGGGGGELEHGRQS